MGGEGHGRGAGTRPACQDADAARRTGRPARQAHQSGEDEGIAVVNEMMKQLFVVVPAKAGTHNHRRCNMSPITPYLENTEYGSPPSRGRRECLGAFA